MDNAFYLSGQRIKTAAFQQFPGRREKRTSEKDPLLGGGFPAIALHIRYDRIESLQSQFLEKKSVLIGQPFGYTPVHPVPEHTDFLQGHVRILLYEVFQGQ